MQNRMLPFHLQAQSVCGGHAKVSTRDAACQAVYDKYILGAKIETMIIHNQQALETNENKVAPAVPSFDNTKDNDKNMKFFTGLTYLHSMALFQFLGDSVTNLTGLTYLHFIALFQFLGDSVTNLTYWNSKATAEKSVLITQGKHLLMNYS